MFRIKDATVREFDLFGAYFIHVTQAIQRNGVRDYGTCAKITAHKARRILVGFITKEDASELGESFARDHLAAEAIIREANQ